MSIIQSKRIIGAVALAAVLTLAPVMSASAQSVDQLLEQVKNGTLQKTKSAADMERRFRSAGAGKAAIVTNLRSQRATLEARSDGLEAQYAANAEELNTIRNQREKALGDLKELFGAIQQVVGESQATFDSSIVSAEFPNRAANFADISRKVSNQSNKLVTAAEIESVWKEVFREMAQQGKVTRFTTSVATASGAREDQAVTRVGVFNLVGDGKFLTYGKGGVAELPRQPDGRYLKAADMASATGSPVEFALDPTAGTLLGAAVESPSLMERVEQGGPVGYLILGVGAIAALIAIFKIITLFGVSAAVKKQAANPGSPSASNPLGRVLKSVADNPTNDTEAMELRYYERNTEVVFLADVSENCIRGCSTSWAARNGVGYDHYVPVDYLVWRWRP